MQRKNVFNSALLAFYETCGFYNVDCSWAKTLMSVKLMVSLTHDCVQIERYMCQSIVNTSF